MRKLGFGNAVWAAAACLLMTACGGTGSISGDGGDDGGSSSGGTAPTVAALTLLSSAPQLSSDAADVNSGVVLTAVTKDASNNVLGGQTVSFSSDSGAIIVSQPTTDTSGRALATLTTDGDPRNRSITVTARSGTRTSVISIAVVGTTLSISGASSTQRNVETPYTLLLADAGGTGIPGQVVQLSTQAGNSLRSGGAAVSSVTTDGSGQASFTLTATNAGSSITATALGLSTVVPVTVSTDDFTFTTPDDDETVIDLGSAPRTLTVTWLQSGAAVPDGTMINFSTTRGTLSANSAATVGGNASVTLSATDAGVANVVASSTALTMPSATRAVRFRATRASTVVVQADPAVIATNETADISAVVRDNNNNLVADKTVEFSLADVSGGTLSSPTAVTNTQGLARVSYRSTSTTTAKNGVTVSVRARNSNGTEALGSTQLTVGSRALRISLGTGNEIAEPNETTYALPYTAIVTDAAGNPATNADFQLSVLPTRYFKGFYVVNADGDIIPFITARCDNEDVNQNGILDSSEDTNGNGVLDAGEDRNGDGILNAQEDADGDGVLDPGNVASVPRSPDLDDDGAVQFDILYPQDRGNWVEVELSARAVVSGSEATEKAVFGLPISADDADNPPATSRPFVDPATGVATNRAESPYGHEASCTLKD